MRLETNRIPPSLEAYLPKEKMNYIPLSLGGGGGQMFYLCQVKK